MKMSSIIRVTISIYALLVLVACQNRPKEIVLTYLVQDNTIKYERTPGSTFLEINPRVRVYAVVTNTSDYGGVFKLRGTLSSQGNTISFEAEDFIASGQKVTLQDEIEVNHYSFEKNITADWRVIAPIKTLND